MKKIILKSAHALSPNEMKGVMGGTSETLHCDCYLSINEKDENGLYKSVDVSDQMDMFSVLSLEACSAACASSCDAYS